MGCCVTKDANALKSGKTEKVEKNIFDSSNETIAKVSPINNVIKYTKLTNRDIFFGKIVEPVSSCIINIPQTKELHAIWSISMLRQLRSEIDTVCLLSRLIEIVELLDPFDGNNILRKHLFESGAAEILAYTMKYHHKTPEILLLCIFLLIHISFNDGISQKIIPIVLPEILELFIQIEKNNLNLKTNNSILLAILKLIFISSSDSKEVSEIWVDSNIGKKVVFYLYNENLDENIQSWGFAALRFLVRSSLEACKEFLGMGLFDLATSKLGKCQDLFMIENILALFVAILTTIEDHNFNNPNIIKDIMNIIKINIYNRSIVEFGLIILLLSSQRTEIYSHIITACDAIKVIQSIYEIYKKDQYHIQITDLCKQLSKCLCSCCSKKFSIGVINNRVYSQADPGKLKF